MIEPHEYYALPGVMTDLSAHAEACVALPDDIPALCAVVQGLLLHAFWAESLGRTLTAEDKQTLNVRRAGEKLALIRAIDSLPLAEARPLASRQVGNCRDFSVLMTAFLRQKGVPARARCGFGRYFLPGHYEDHWICEYWHAPDERWIMVDAQLDAFQCKEMQIDFDPCDVPVDSFWPAGRAWQTCRAGLADPDDFGIFDLHGLWFIRGNLLRDLAALNKVELLPWDCWGLADRDEAALTAGDQALLDTAAELTTSGDMAFDRMAGLYHERGELRVPAVIRCYGDGGPRDVVLDPGGGDVAA